MSNIYEQNIIDNYKSPINFGKLSKYTHSAKFANLSCGDEITVYLEVEDNIVKDLKFEGSGCALSIASMSIVSEKLIGMNINDVLMLKYEDITDIIGIIPNPSRSKCVLTGLEAVRKSLVKS